MGKMFYFSYPSNNQYGSIASGLILRFPHLKDCHQLAGDAITVWHQRIKRHFKSSRQKNCENIPAIINQRLVYKRRKSNNNEECLQKQTVAARAWGVDNYLPKRIEGEDDASIENHTKRMIDMSRLHKDRRPKNVVDLLMQKTFPERRSMVVEGLVKVPEMKQQYPLLFAENEVNI